MARLLTIFLLSAISAHGSRLYVSGIIEQVGTYVSGENGLLTMAGWNYAAFLDGSPGAYSKPLPAIGANLVYDAFAAQCPSPVGCQNISIEGQVGWIGELSLHQTAPGSGWIGTYSIYAGVPGWPSMFQFVASQDVMAASVTQVFGQQGVVAYSLAAPEPAAWAMLALGIALLSLRSGPLL